MPDAINLRDLDYIETRLMAPATDVLDAVERLRKLGHADLAQDIMGAVQDFTDRCRVLRNDLLERRAI